LGRGRRRCCSRGCGGRLIVFQLVNTVFQRLNAVFVGRLHRFQLLFQLCQPVVIRRGQTQPLRRQKNNAYNTQNPFFHAALPKKCAY
jgi:hypothetical protein